MQEGSVDLGRDPATPRQVGDDDDYSDGDDDDDGGGMTAQKGLLAVKGLIDVGD